MKTLKLALVAALIACAMVSLASSGGVVKTPVVNIPIEKAILCHGLAVAMYQQLSDDFLSVEKPVYYRYVRYNKTVYRISGSYDQWRNFFDSKWRILISKKRVAKGND